MPHLKLTDRGIKTLRPTHGDVMDTVVDRMGIRGDGSVPAVTFFVYTRFPGPDGVLAKGPTRRTSKMQ
jgi:hypothetical protein